MKTLSFEAPIEANGILTVPADVAAQVPSGRSVRVVLLLDVGEDADWERLAAEDFLTGYAPEDAIYNDL